MLWLYGDERFEAIQNFYMKLKAASIINHSLKNEMLIILGCGAAVRAAESKSYHFRIHLFMCT